MNNERRESETRSVVGHSTSWRRAKLPAIGLESTMETALKRVSNKSLTTDALPEGNQSFPAHQNYGPRVVAARVAEIGITGVAERDPHQSGDHHIITAVLVRAESS